MNLWREPDAVPLYSTWPGNVLPVSKQSHLGPDLGPALTLTGYEQELTAFSTSLDGYNEKLAALDELQNSVEAAEASLRDKNKRILSAVEAQFGPDSSEYEQAGGTRQSDCRCP